MIRHLLLTACVLGLAGGAGCATTAQVGGNLETRRPANRGNVLSGEEIMDRAASSGTALAAIRRLRPDWLRRLGRTSLQGATPVRVYLDNVHAGDFTFLDGYPIDRVYELRYYSATEATSRWGTNHTAGAVEVISGIPGDPTTTRGGRVAPADAAPEDPGAVPFGFSPTFMYQLNSGTAVLRTPDEVSSVWRGDANAGFAVGIQATPSVAVYLASEFNRFQFDEDGTLEYFLTRERGRLSSTDNVELAGDPSTIFNVSLNIKVHPRTGLVRPFFTGGLGYGRLNAGAFRLSGPDGSPLPRTQFNLQVANGGDQTENSFSVAGGAGVDLRVKDRWRLFGDVRYITLIRGPRYRDAYGEFQLFNTSYYPIRIGIAYH